MSVTDFRNAVTLGLIDALTLCLNRRTYELYYGTSATSEYQLGQKKLRRVSKRKHRRTKTRMA